MNILEELITDAFEDPYLKELVYKLENIYNDRILRKEISESLLNKEYFDILRFADLLSFDSESKGKNLAYRIISFLHQSYSEDIDYKVYSNTILTRLGNFPSLGLIDKNDKKLDTFESHIEKNIKYDLHRTPDNKNVFTDTQYSLFNKLIESNHFSFSAPTSFGKSFIIDAFVDYIIEIRKGIDNIVIMVPTRALISEFIKRYKSKKYNNYVILSQPVVPKMYINKGYKYIFVLTPERLISYFGKNFNPSIQYMFIDESQKIIAEKDSRSPLYYHAISIAERKSVNLFFASPNIKNPDIFLRLFDKSIDESITIKDNSVSQNILFVDLIEREEWTFHELGNSEKRKGFGRYNTLNELLLSIGQNENNIIYCNSVADTIRYALDFSRRLPNQNNGKIDEVIDLIKTYVHEEYYLIDCIRKGVGFHFGRLPQRIREKVEELYSNSNLNYIFCTSTLLEGVNLPAKNIFILTNRIGLSKFKKIDFWNLAGRAGRLNKELSGNIICVRCESEKWTKKDAEILINGDINKVETPIISDKRRFYKNLDNSIKGKEFTRKKMSEDERKYINNYANIVYTNEITGADSLINNNFIKNTKIDGKKTLLKINQNNLVDSNILQQSIMIKPKYQNEIIKNKDESMQVFPDEVTYNNCLKILEELYNKYNWENEESSGTKPLIKSKGKLKYYAMLMNSWMNSKPLSVIIKETIIYYSKIGSYYNTYLRKEERFNPNDRATINYVINELISDIENDLRFKIKNYVVNYQLLLESIYGKSGQNWADFLEYGTNDKLIIELQNLGLSRNLAKFLKDNFLEYIYCDGSDIHEIDKYRILEKIDKVKYKDVIEEIEQILQ